MATEESIQTKVCSQCREALPFASFGLIKGKPRAECRRCLTQRSLAYQRANPDKYKACQRASRQRNAETVKEDHRRRYERYKNDPAWLSQNRRKAAEWRAKNRERHREYSRNYADEHSEEVRKYRREHYLSHKEQHRLRSIEWRNKNRERHREHGRIDGRRRYLGRDTETYAYAETLRLDPCSYCGAPGPSVVDHIVPLSKGGENKPYNLTAACLSCNSRKRDKPLLAFLLSLVGDS